MTKVSVRDMISIITPSITETEYNVLASSFRLSHHFEETIKVEGKEVNAWNYYKARLQEFIIPLMELFPKEEPIWLLFKKFETIAYEGGFRTFRPLIDFIRNNASPSYPLVEQETLDKATLAFTRLAIARYLKEQFEFDGYLKRNVLLR